MSVETIVKRYLEGQTSAAAAFHSMEYEDYLEGLPIILDALLELDFREALDRDRSIHMIRHEQELSAFFCNLTGVASSDPQRLQAHVEKMRPLVHWWVQVLTNTKLSLPGTESALQQIVGCLSMLLTYVSAKNSETILAIAIDSLKVKSASPAAGSIITQLAQQDKQVVSKHMDEVLDALEREVDEGALSGLLTAIDSVYQRCADSVDARIDTIIEIMMHRSSASIAGSMIIKKVAKKTPRVLYAFVDDLVPLLSKQHRDQFILGAFSDIAARNALLFKDHLKEIAFASEEIGLSYNIGLPAIGYIGRINETKAQEALQILVGWIQNDVDPAANSKILEQIRNIGGVYKKTLDPHMDNLKKLCSHGDSDVKDEATKLVEYYDGHNEYLPNAFLENQEDIYGRIIEVVNSAVEAKTAGFEEDIEKLARRAEHQSMAIEQVQEKHYVLADSVKATEGRVNKLELLANEHERRIETAEEAVGKVEEELAKKTDEIKEFIADISKKLPLPVSVEARGTIRKRMLLRFRCAAGTEPDFVLETVHWTKWLRVAASALNTGKNILFGDVGGTISGLFQCFQALKRKDTDPNVTFDNLVKQPFLTSAEEDEIISGLRSQGFFDEFEYDPKTATWIRKKRKALTTFADTTSSAYTAKTTDSKECDSETRAFEAVKDGSEQERNEGNNSMGTSGNGSENSTESTALPFVDDNTILCKGFFKKKGQVRKNIKQRYYEVMPKALNYYTDSSKTNLKGTVLMENVSSVETQSGQWIRLITAGIHGGFYDIHVLDPDEYNLFLSSLQRYCYAFPIASNTLIQDCEYFLATSEDSDEESFNSATTTTRVFNVSSDGKTTNSFGPVFKITGWLHDKSSKDGLILWFKDIPDAFGNIIIEDLPMDLSLANPEVQWDETPKQKAISHLRKEFKVFDNSLSIMVLVDRFEEQLPVLNFPGN